MNETGAFVPTVSVTELLTLMKCVRQWSFRYANGLVPVERSDALVSGTVVHRVLASVLKGEVRQDNMSEAVNREIAEEEESEQKRVPLASGILHALGQVPSWVWARQWVVEERLTVEVEGVQVVGVPDLVSVGGDMLIEVKTTEHNPLDFLLGNPQHRWYLAMLQETTQSRPINFLYLCLPLRGRAPDSGIPWYWSIGAHAEAQIELSNMVRRWKVERSVFGKVPDAAPPGTYSSVCSYCDYKTFCTLIVQGRRWQDGLASREFRQAVRRE